jgi:hypothetical protein
VGVDSNATGAKLVDSMVSLVVGGSQETTRFVGALKDNYNVDVQQIDVLIAPRIFVGGPVPSPAPSTAAPPPEEETDPMPVIITALSVFAGLSVLGVVGYIARCVRWLVQQHCNS